MKERTNVTPIYWLGSHKRVPDTMSKRWTKLDYHIDSEHFDIIGVFVLGCLAVQLLINCKLFAPHSFHLRRVFTHMLPILKFEIELFLSVAGARFLHTITIEHTALQRKITVPKCWPTTHARSVILIHRVLSLYLADLWPTVCLLLTSLYISSAYNESPPCACFAQVFSI